MGRHTGEERSQSQGKEREDDLGCETVSSCFQVYVVELL